ncbi:phage virion morphogenesis protein [Escherichia coli]|uniref:phage virion morphogenesis protein n=1 Tax=Escherichia coli TaxID=562 RepID=UPI002FCCF1EE
MTRPVINESQLRQVRRAIREAELPPAKARKLLVRIAKYGLIPAARRNVKAQRTPEGAAWAPRKRPDKASGRYKNKMLLGLPKLLAIRVDGSGKSVRLSSKKGITTPALMVGRSRGCNSTAQPSKAAPQNAGTAKPCAPVPPHDGRQNAFFLWAFAPPSAQSAKKPDAGDAESLL